MGHGIGGADISPLSGTACRVVTALVHRGTPSKTSSPPGKRLASRVNRS
jgi:hypothetical protein